MIAPAATLNLDALGAVGDGVADDTFIFQQAVHSASVYGGTSTIVLSPGKTYRTTEPIDLNHTGGVRFAGGGTWLCDSLTVGLRLNRYHEDDAHPANPISPATAGQTTVTTTNTPTGLAVGDWVLIYTGNLVPVPASGYPIGTPDAELNRVTSLTGNTVGLERPLAKDYAQEFYNPGETSETGTTNTTNTGDPAPLALRRIDPLDGLHFDGITIEHNGTDSFLQGNAVADLTMANVDMVTAHSVMSISTWTGSLTASSFHSTLDTGDTPSDTPWWFTSAYGARDITVTDCELSADGVGYVHIHEGSSNIAFANVTFTNGAGVDVGPHYVIGIRGRGYGITFDNVTVTNISTTPGSAGLRVDSGVTGSAVGSSFVSVVNDSADFTVTP